MTKNEYILKILDKLGDYRPISRGLKVLILKDKLNNDQISGLLDIFEQAIKNASDKTEKEKLQKGIEVIKRIQLLEENQSKQDSKDLKKLEDLIEKI